MAVVEHCSDNCGISPRISFSYDFCQSDIVPIDQHPLPSGSLDFDFCVRKSFDQDSSSADELFSNGKILPTEIKKKTNLPDKRTDPTSTPSRNDSSKTEEGSKEVIKNGISDEAEQEQDQEKQSSKSFWRFKRSSSLNCGSGYGRTLCPLPPLLSRSNSTGSTPSVKRSPFSKDSNNKHQKQTSIKSSSSSSNYHQKPPLRKNYGSYGNGVRVNPVLNVPSGNLFGLGSIFFNGKDKSKKK